VVGALTGTVVVGATIAGGATVVGGDTSGPPATPEKANRLGLPIAILNNAPFVAELSREVDLGDLAD
jgi:hypothetical protein